MKKTFKIILPLLILLIVVVSISQNNKENPDVEQKVVRVGYLPLADHLPLMVAEGGDLFEGVEVEAIKFTDWPSLVEALKSGAIDGAHVINSLAIKMVFDGYEGQAVALSHRGTIALATSEELNDVQD